MSELDIESPDPKPSRDMGEEEAALAKRIDGAIQRAATHTDRGQQAAEFRVGISDLGYCSERTRRMLDHQVPEDSDMFKAWIGTALGDALEDAVVAAFPGAIKQSEVTVTLVGDKRTFQVLGHPDLILPEEGIVLDGKSAFGLNLARRMGADQQKQFQRHGYGAGAWDAGFFGDLGLKDVRVGNVWLDRSGVESSVHVQLEPFDFQVLFEATHWLEEVIEHYIAGTEAQKEPPREVCASTCGFFSVCRALDTDVTGLLEGRETIEAVQLYLDGKKMASEGEKFKREAKAALDGVSGSTGQHTVRWVSVDEVQVKAGVRRAHKRLDIRAI